MKYAIINITFLLNLSLYLQRPIEFVACLLALGCFYYFDTRQHSISDSDKKELEDVKSELKAIKNQIAFKKL